jgi:hypothetical protein
MSSLIAHDEAQFRLTTADMPNERFAPSETSGEYTGERLFRNRRQEYDLIVRMLAEGMSAISISRIMQCAEKTVAAVRERESAFTTTTEQKNAHGNRWRHINALYGDILVERATDPLALAKLSTKDAAIVASIATQNWQLLAGEATARVEHVEQDRQHNDFNRFVEQLKSAVTVEATTIPTTPEPEPAQLPAPQRP